jgi:hypothetical protein
MHVVPTTVQGRLATGASQRIVHLRSLWTCVVEFVTVRERERGTNDAPTALESPSVFLLGVCSQVPRQVALVARAVAAVLADKGFSPVCNRRCVVRWLLSLVR